MLMTLHITWFTMMKVLFFITTEIWTIIVLTCRWIQCVHVTYSVCWMSLCILMSIMTQYMYVNEMLNMISEMCFADCSHHNNNYSKMPGYQFHILNINLKYYILN